MLGQKIKRLRKQSGMTQEDLADLLHVTRSAVSSWETGVRTPDIYMLRKIANLFGVSLDYIVGCASEHTICKKE